MVVRKCGTTSQPAGVGNLAVVRSYWLYESPTSIQDETGLSPGKHSAKETGDKMKREMPREMTNYREDDMSSLLPYEALGKLELIALTPKRNYGADPYILYDHWGHILYQWPNDYEPSLTEVREVSQRFL